MTGGFGGLLDFGQQAIADKFNRLSLGDDRETKLMWYGDASSNAGHLYALVNDLVKKTRNSTQIVSSEPAVENIILRLNGMEIIKAAPQVEHHEPAHGYNVDFIPYWKIIIPLSTVNTERLDELETKEREKQVRRFGWGQ
jgi:hypothetical protein